MEYSSDGEANQIIDASKFMKRIANHNRLRITEDIDLTTGEQIKVEFSLFSLPQEIVIDEEFEAVRKNGNEIEKYDYVAESNKTKQVEEAKRQIKKDKLSQKFNWTAQDWIDLKEVLGN